ncbi:hypothetical protein AAMO2058_001357600 [Amorphochlora amoebiformis]
MVLSSIKHALFLALIAFGGGAGIQRGRLGRVFNPKIPRIGEGGYPNVGTRAVMSTLERKRSGRGVTRGQRGGDKGYIEALREKKLKFRRLTGTDEDVAKNAMFLTKVFNNGFGETATIQTFQEADLVWMWETLGNITSKGLYNYFREGYKSKEASSLAARTARVSGEKMGKARSRWINRKRQFSVLVVEDAKTNELVGSVTVTRKDPYELPMAFVWGNTELQFYVSNLAIAQRYRRKGIAKCLLNATETLARRWGCESVWLHVEEPNSKAIQLYTSNGYILIFTI